VRDDKRATGRLHTVVELGDVLRELDIEQQSFVDRAVLSQTAWLHHYEQTSRRQ